MDIRFINNKGVSTLRPQNTVHEKAKPQETFVVQKKETQKTQKTIQTSFVQNVTGVTYTPDSLEEKKKRTLSKGKDFLAELEKLRICLLEGKISKDILTRLKFLLDKKNDYDLSADLKNLIDDIETRVAVEIAKYEN